MDILTKELRKDIEKGGFKVSQIESTSPWDKAIVEFHKTTQRGCDYEFSVNTLDSFCITLERLARMYDDFDFDGEKDFVMHNVTGGDEVAAYMETAERRGIILELLDIVHAYIERRCKD